MDSWNSLTPIRSGKMSSATLIFQLNWLTSDAFRNAEFSFFVISFVGSICVQVQIARPR